MSLEIQIIGSSGSGKSTICKIIADILEDNDLEFTITGEVSEPAMEFQDYRISQLQHPNRKPIKISTIQKLRRNDNE